MAKQSPCEKRHSIARLTRREILKGAAVVTAGTLVAAPGSAAGPGTHPTIPLGPHHQVTRLIVGSNPTYGYSHFNSLLDELMVEYFTDETVVQFLLDC